MLFHFITEGGLSRFSKSKKSDSLQDEKRKAVSDDTSGYRISASNILADLMSANIEYEEIWKNLDEEDNPDQTFLMQMVRDEKHAEVETELRKVSILRRVTFRVENKIAYLDVRIMYCLFS